MQYISIDIPKQFRNPEIHLQLRGSTSYMCGILCLVSSGTYSVPPCFSDVVSKRDLWSTSDPKIIESFVKKDRQHTVLTLQDSRKLAGLDSLRTLNLELIKLNNNVKIRDDEAINAVQEQIDAIIGNESQEESHYYLTEEVFEALVYKIASRGPDYLGYIRPNENLQLFSSVLSLRQPFQLQPEEEDGFFLQFNGELYNEECMDGNDTRYIMEQLKKSCSADPAPQSRDNAILRVLCLLEGEFAFAIHDLVHKKVFFGRDSIGKRSLLYSLENKELWVSSLPHPGKSFVECANEVMTYDIDQGSLIHYSYPQLNKILGIDTNQEPNPLPYTPVLDHTHQLQRLHEVLAQATLIRQQSIHPLYPEDASLAVLFSGGLDCTLVAAMACHNFLNSSVFKPDSNHIIDLLTVGFDNPRTNQSASLSPDRLLAKKSWFHLCQHYQSPRLQIRLVEITIPYETWLLHKRHVQGLMSPAHTEMDLSIAIAFYFASATHLENCISKIALVGQPTYQEFMANEAAYTLVEQNYQSTTKVLFSGLGADELFAGYSRHESLFINSLHPQLSPDEISACYTQLSTELIHDIDIIHHRNLGRDDRVISSWGKELRYPYLDPVLISHVINDIEPNLKFHYHYETITTKKRGTQTVMRPIRKYLLRELARQMGLEWVQHELKRAIQFGAKSAKMEIGQSKVKGTDKLLRM